MLRILAAAPLIATGHIVASVGYVIAGAAHRNPLNRDTPGTYDLTWEFSID